MRLIINRVVPHGRADTGRTPGIEHDVIIIGGGPGGAVAASLLLKYRPELDVVVLEKERFPREHVGESLLLGVCQVLHEMGAWDAVERCEFPIKIGGTYTWGRDLEDWNYDFCPESRFRDLGPRPGRYSGARKRTAFQVDRGKFDQVLLDHARDLGATVVEGARVERVENDGDRIVRVVTNSGESYAGRHFIDASGAARLLGRALKIGSWQPKTLKNVAIYGYWEGLGWAAEPYPDVTRVQVRSLRYGWLWYIPQGRHRTSIGLVCPTSYLKDSGLAPEELYSRAIEDEPRIRELCARGARDGELRTAKNWSHLSDRLAGENWYMVGECCGFADPILTAGLNLTFSSARDAAFSILEHLHGEEDPTWLSARYSERHRVNIRQHIRFAEYWYAANTCFEDLKEYCREIVAEGGFAMTADDAWAWLAQGGFAYENPGTTAIGSFDAVTLKELVRRFSEDRPDRDETMSRANRFVFKRDEVRQEDIGWPLEGRVHRVAALRRSTGQLTPVVGPMATTLHLLLENPSIHAFLTGLKHRHERGELGTGDWKTVVDIHVDCLTGLYLDGMLEATFDPAAAPSPLRTEFTF